MAKHRQATGMMIGSGDSRQKCQACAHVFHQLSAEMDLALEKASLEATMRQEDSAAKMRDLAAAELSRAQIACEQAMERYAAARAAMLCAQLRQSMNVIMRDLTSLFLAVADNLGDMRRLAVAYDDFLSYFLVSDGEWKAFNRLLHDKNVVANMFPIMEFATFHDNLTQMVGCMAPFLRVELRKAFAPLDYVLESFRYLRRDGANDDENPLGKTSDLKLEEFEEALEALREQLKNPGAIFVFGETRPVPPPASPETTRQTMRRAKRAVLLDVNHDISQYGYVVEGDRKVIRFKGKPYRLTARKVVVKVNEMIRTLYETPDRPEVSFEWDIKRQFARGVYASFLTDCIVQPSDPKMGGKPLPVARLRIADER